MALIEHTMFGKIDKVQQAIDRIKSFDPVATGLMDTPYYVAYSGGKDSDVIRILCELAGVKHDLVHNHTTVDAPETVRYVRSIPNIIIDFPKMSMWRLIESKHMPPTRLARYCCDHLKERGGKDRFVMTGVRWAESSRRKNQRGSVEVQRSKIKESLILNADNDESRQMMERCQLKGKYVLNPIIDWSDDDVWDFLDYYGCQSNPLYQCGDKRIGCVGCPLSRVWKRKAEFARYPKYKDNYIRAFDRMLIAHPSDNWHTGQEVFDWWMDDRKNEKIPDGQIEMEE